MRTIEVERLESAARDALDGGDLSAAAETIQAGLQLSPARFLPLRDQLLTAATGAPDTVAATLHAALYEMATTPEARIFHREEAQQAAARARFVESELETTTASHAGVTRAMAHKALHTLSAEYVDPIDDEALLRAAASRLALLSASPVSVPKGERSQGFDALFDQGVDLGLPESTVVAELTEAAFEACDPYSSPIWPAQVAAWSRHHAGRVDGVVGVQLDGDPLEVIDLAEGGSAWNANVHQGDRILAVTQGEQRVDASAGVDRIVAALRGESGTSVRLEVERDGTPLAFELTRGSLSARTVFGWQRTREGFDAFVEPRIASLRIAAFRPHSLQEFDAILPSRDQLDGLVLDLRGNSGGDLASAIAIADRFVAAGPLLRIDGRVLPSFEAGWSDASPGDAWEGLPLAVIVDHRSASSAEVLAGALAHGAQATLVGERTTGKGLSQVLRTDEELGFAIQFTNLAWTLPNGARLHRSDEAALWGIEPTIHEALSPMEGFMVGVAQAKRERLQVHQDGSPMRYAGPEVDPELPPFTSDPPLARALAALKSGG